MDVHAETYLQEEIKAEALTRNIGHFARFLEVAARQNGQVTNVAGIARDAALAYSRRHYRIHFWRNYDGVEVDFLCETSKGYVAAEFKASARWEKPYSRGLHRMQAELGERLINRYGVYLGDRAALWDDVHVLPVRDFLQRLWDGGVLE